MSTLRDDLVAHAAACRAALDAGVPRPMWAGGDLRGADLRGAVLSRAYLSRAYLTGAYLSGADLSGADLTSANLSGAVLTGADLTSANLSGAYLTGADLTSANLSGAVLSGAVLSGAVLTGARGIRCAGPVGVEGRLIYGVDHGVGAMVHAGCAWLPVADMMAAVEARYADGTWREQHRAAYLAAVAWVGGV